MPSTSCSSSFTRPLLYWNMNDQMMTDAYTGSANGVRKIVRSAPRPRNVSWVRIAATRAEQPGEPDRQHGEAAGDRERVQQGAADRAVHVHRDAVVAQPGPGRALPVADVEQRELLEADQDPEDHRDEVHEQFEQQGRQQEQVRQAALPIRASQPGRLAVAGRTRAPGRRRAGRGRVVADTDRPRLSPVICCWALDSWAFTVAALTGLPDAASANRFFTAVPTTVSNCDSFATWGMATASRSS